MGDKIIHEKEVVERVVYRDRYVQPPTSQPAKQGDSDAFILFCIFQWIVLVVFFSWLFSNIAIGGLIVAGIVVCGFTYQKLSGG